MANKFKRGDIVQLKSGGPPMTVDKCPGDPEIGMARTEYQCEWFKGATATQRNFAEHVLQAYVAPTKAK